MSVHLVTGDEASLVSEAVRDLVDALVGDGDRSLMVDDFDGDFDVAALVDAAQTPPFLTEHRVVIGREIGAFDTAALAPLVAYLDDPLPSTHLLLVAGGGRLAKSLTDAVKRSGGTTTSATPPAKAKFRVEWVQERAERHGVKLTDAAVNRIERWLGEDAALLHGLLGTLAGAYDPGRVLDVADVEPFLGDAGGVPPWDLTDAIDAGDPRRALTLLERMMQGGERHPLAIMAILHGHYVKMLQLDGRDVASEAEAVAVLGMTGSTYPAKKALVTYQRLGAGGVQRAIELLAGADLDLKGAKAWPPELVVEVLVARLARLAPATARRR